MVSLWQRPAAIGKFFCLSRGDVMGGVIAAGNGHLLVYRVSRQASALLAWTYPGCLASEVKRIAARRAGRYDDNKRVFNN